MNNKLNRRVVAAMKYAEPAPAQHIEVVTPPEDGSMTCGSKSVKEIFRLVQWIVENTPSGGLRKRQVWRQASLEMA